MTIAITRDTVLVGADTAAIVIARAYRRLQATDIAEQPSDAELSNGLSALSEMIDAWAFPLPEVAPQVLTGTTANADATVTFADDVKLADGLSVSGTGIPASATVLSVTSKTEIELSANATASGTVSLTFTPIPFPARHRKGIIALLAAYMAGDNGLPDAPPRVAQDADEGWTMLLADYMPDNQTVFDRALTARLPTWDINSG